MGNKEPEKRNFSGTAWKNKNSNLKWKSANGINQISVFIKF